MVQTKNDIVKANGKVSLTIGLKVLMKEEERWEIGVGLLVSYNRIF